MDTVKTLLTNLLTALCLVVLAQTFCAPAAQAYLDPGTGQFIIQTLFGMGLACAVTLARFKKRVFEFFQKNKNAPQDPVAQVEPSDK